MKAEDVEALERRVKWLEEGPHLVRNHLKFLAKRHGDLLLQEQLQVMTQLGAIVDLQRDWLSRRVT